ncbi:MAG: trehalase family glycosidase [Candidatus Acidiferrales bacterium]
MNPRARIKHVRIRIAAFVLAALAGVAPAFTQQAKPDGLAEIQQYIAGGWDSLTRSLTNCDTLRDKLGQARVLYLPNGLPAPAAVHDLQKKCSAKVEHLPDKIEKLASLDLSHIKVHGLLYLEHPYVVPGGFFNEMYGWDSYFISRGLVRDGRVDLARGMVENFFFEIDHYGAILNSNRTYHLTRSQPPFLTSMILAVYEAEKAAGRESKSWLEKAYRYAVRDHALWVEAPHLAGDTGLSRYYDFGEGPAPEVPDAEYQYIVRHLLRNPEMDRGYLAASDRAEDAALFTGPVFTVKLCSAEKAEQAQGRSRQPADAAKDGCETIRTAGLTRDFYKGDRSVRESGFDISFRFGPFSGSTHHFAPVCLNSLLYKVETDLEHMALLLGRASEAANWRERARIRKERMSRYFWDSAAGLFFDYDFKKQKRSSYIYASAFYPLWAGLASPEQAAALVENLPLFEEPGGIVMSRTETKSQWDYPYGWGPIQLIAAEGLRRHGYDEDANRISVKFLATVLGNFARDRTIREKYNVVTRSSETRVEVGYADNVIGFGWTNGAFVALLDALPAEWKARLEKAVMDAVAR